ncbi:MAG TPA: hypothetical protein VFE62_23450 [Gemmataceae bacterium]|nr:hypothetical protein [Gemmataceae bacterium]
MIVIDIENSLGLKVAETFLIDSGADASAFSADLLVKLGGATAQATSGVSIVGIGGGQAYVRVLATLRLPRMDGGTATVQASFPAFTDAGAIEFSILGRDVLDLFDVILSRKRNEVVLLAPPSRYEIQP